MSVTTAEAGQCDIYGSCPAGFVDRGGMGEGPLSPIPIKMMGKKSKSKTGPDSCRSHFIWDEDEGRCILQEEQQWKSKKTGPDSCRTHFVWNEEEGRCTFQKDLMEKPKSRNAKTGQDSCNFHFIWDEDEGRCILEME
jgi:hypothetical protein